MTRYVPIPKPVKRIRTRKQVRRVSPQQRAEQRVIAKVVKDITPRDGRCRLVPQNRAMLAFIGPCDGPTDPCHLREWMRSKTRGEAPEVRHNRRGIFLGCRSHHRKYDGYVFDLDYNPTMGADGYLVPIPHKLKGVA